MAALTPDRLREFREALEAEQRAALATIAVSEGNMALITAARQDNTDDEHDPEGVTLAFERSQESTMVRLAQERVALAAEALARIDAGTYGICTSCGSPIAVERLEARPSAALCIDCARKLG